MATLNYANYAQNYECKICHFISCKKNDYDRHVSTQKHKNNTSATFSNTLATENTHTCDICNKKYKDRTGLWRHKKKCNQDNKIISNIEIINNKNENTKLQYDIQRKLYTYLIHNLDKNAEVNFSLVFTNDILNNDEEYWETKFETKINIENIEEEIKDLISNSLEIEKVLFEY